MKNYKIISLLALAALMTACNTNNSKASYKNPVTLAKLGKEVEVSVLEDLFKNPDFLKPWVDLDANHYPSSVITATDASTYESTYTSKNKVVGRENGIERTDIVVKTDTKNQRLYNKNDNVMNYTNEIYGNKSIQNINFSSELTYQFLKTVEDDAEKMYYVLANQNEHTCTFIQDVTLESSAARLDIIEAVASSIFDDKEFGPYSMAYSIFDYSSSTPEEKEKFKFYQNKDVYSVVYTEEMTIVDMLDDDILASISKTKIEKTFQIDVSKGCSYVYKTMNVRDVETTYLSNFIDSNNTVRFIDDVLKEKTTESFSVDVKVQDTKVNEVDVSNFEKVFNF